MATEECTETLDQMADKKVAHLHEILRIGFTEANGESFPSTILESWGSGLRNFNGNDRDIHRRHYESCIPYRSFLCLGRNFRNENMNFDGLIGIRWKV
ncbi:hypothetical protein AXG93_1913s1180 [Marchantia polymorpha subsp. ruderalis]|uniref:Uncharacterized protein n=1 Tax=Marchantia polymorpha subsp. ruderalis TaxID=1480154 RepID=A0A176WLA6_MARPO|nr:hypothetical protein AXG93_1913s1180 [Marchantia polymorpha subsp. ruderalis]